MPRSRLDKCVRVLLSNRRCQMLSYCGYIGLGACGYPNEILFWEEQDVKIQRP
jgi:hypothetical protein